MHGRSFVRQTPLFGRNNTSQERYHYLFLCVICSLCLSLDAFAARAVDNNDVSADFTYAGRCSITAFTEAKDLKDPINRKPGHTPTGIESGHSATPDLFSGSLTTRLDLFTVTRPGNPPLELFLTNRQSHAPSISGMGWELSLPYIQRDSTFGLSYSLPEFEYINASGRTQLIHYWQNRFGAKFESDFRIFELIFVDDHPTWVVKEKSGRRLYFGEVAQARLSAPNDANCVYRWYLTKIDDVNGEVIEFEYESRTKNHSGMDAVAIELKSINYGKNRFIDSAHDNTLLLSYERTPNPDLWLRPGFPVVSDGRLKKVTHSYNGTIINSVYVDYEFNPANGRYLLKETVLEDASGNRQLPNTIKYIDSPFDFGKTIVKRPFGSGVTNHIRKSGYLYGDFDGDGRTDIAYIGDARDASRDRSPFQDILVMRGSKSGFSGSKRWAAVPNVQYGKANNQWFSGDVNGDGKSDLVWFGNLGTRPNDYRRVIRVYLSNGSGFSTARNRYWNTYGMVGVYSPDRRITDINGDGRDDIVWAVKDNFTVYALLSGRTSFSKRMLALSNATPRTVTQGWVTSDMDSDGRADFTYIDPKGGVWLSKSTSSVSKASFSAPKKIGILGNGDVKRYCFGDFNGDQLIDAGYIDPNGKLEIAYYDGVVLTSVIRQSISNALSSSFSLICRDTNGDGASDIVLTNFSTVTGRSEVSVHSVTSSSVHTIRPASSTVLGIPNSSDYSSRVSLADFRGSGALDLVYIKADGNISLVPGHGAPPTLIRHLTSSSGSTTKIAYASSGDFKNFNLLKNIPVVTQIEQYDGIRGKETAKITYEGGFYHRALREFRGFSKAIVETYFSSSQAPYKYEVRFHQGNWGVNPTNPISDPGVLKGLKHSEKISDLTGNAWQSKEYAYRRPNSKLIYFTPLELVRTKRCQSNVKCTESSHAYQYDQLGNIKEELLTENTTDSINKLKFLYDYSVTHEDSTSGDRYTVRLSSVEAHSVDLEGNSQWLSKSFIDYGCEDDKSVLPASPVERICVTQWVDENQSITNRYILNKRGMTREIHDHKGGVYTLDYDRTSRWPTIITNSLGETVRMEYSGVDDTPVSGGAVGAITSIHRNDESLVFRVEYDGFRRIREIETGTGDISTWSYLDYANPSDISIQYRRNDGTSIDYARDGYGRVIRKVIHSKTFGDSTQDWEYLPNGNVFRIVHPFNSSGSDTEHISSFAYDYLGRLLETKTPSGRYRKNEYQLEKAVAVYGQEGKKGTNRADHFYDNFGNLTAVTQYVGNQVNCSNAGEHGQIQTQYKYDVLGRVTEVVGPGPGQISLSYDGLGRRVFLSDPNIGKIRWKYNDDTNSVRQAFGENCQTDKLSNNGVLQNDCRVVEARFDILDRPIEVNASSGVDGDATHKELVYSPVVDKGVSRLEMIRTDGLKYQYKYDGQGRLIKATARIGWFRKYSNQFEYDKVGRVSGIKYPDSTYVQYQYDKGLLRTVTLDDNLLLSVQDYSPQFMPRELLFGDGTERVSSYDAEGRLKGIEWNNPSNGWKRAVSYEFDIQGRVNTTTTIAPHKGTEKYIYDGLGRLSKVTAQNEEREYCYDARGNIVEHPRFGVIAYDTNHPVDAPKSGDNLEAVYDSEGRFISGRLENTEINAQYRADGSLKKRSMKSGDLEIRLREDSTLPEQVSIRKWTSSKYDPWDDDDYSSTRLRQTNLLDLSLREGWSWKNIVRLGDQPVAIAQRRGFFRRYASPTFLHTDRLGSPLFATSEEGVVVGNNSYEEFGKEQSPEGFDAPVGYIGVIKPSYGELLALGPRSYSPSLGQFLGPDPSIPDIYQPQNLNRYTYAQNNPLTMKDPSGYEPMSPGGSISAPFPDFGTGIGIGITIGVGTSYGGGGGSSRGTSIAPARVQPGRSSGIGYTQQGRTQRFYSHFPSENTDSGIARWWSSLDPSVRGMATGIGLMATGVVAVVAAIPVATAGLVGLAGTMAAVAIASGGMSLATGAVITTTSAMGQLPGMTRSTRVSLEKTTDQLARYGSGVISAHTSVIGLVVNGERGAEIGNAVGGLAESVIGAPGAATQIFDDTSNWYWHSADFMNNLINGAKAAESLNRPQIPMRNE